MHLLSARSFGCDLCILLTDVDGVYDRPPKEAGAKLLPFFSQDHSVRIGEKSLHGRGGMESKITAAQFAVAEGSKCRACVVCNGDDMNAIRSVVGGEEDESNGTVKGTLFATPGSELETMALLEAEEANVSLMYSNVSSLCINMLIIITACEQNHQKRSSDSISNEAKTMATSARLQARKLQSLTYSDRQTILLAIADALQSNKEVLLEANQLDLEIAAKENTADVLVKRLKLTEAKLKTLSDGIRQIASQPDPLNVVKCRRELAEGLILSQITVPIGVLMIIFESRPDSFPQIAALAIASGNGLLLKGGKEARYSNEALHNVIRDAIEKGSGGKVGKEIVALVTSRGQVSIF